MTLLALPPFLSPSKEISRELDASIFLIFQKRPLLTEIHGGDNFTGVDDFDLVNRGFTPPCASQTTIYSPSNLPVNPSWPKMYKKRKKKEKNRKNRSTKFPKYVDNFNGGDDFDLVNGDFVPPRNSQTTIYPLFNFSVNLVQLLYLKKSDRRDFPNVEIISLKSPLWFAESRHRVTACQPNRDLFAFCNSLC